MECPAIPCNYIIQYNSISPILYFDIELLEYTYVLLIKIRYYLIIICSISLNCIISEADVHDNSTYITLHIRKIIWLLFEKKLLFNTIEASIDLIIYIMWKQKMIQLVKLYPKVDRYQFHWNFIVLANFSFRYLLEWSETGNGTIYVRRARDLVSAHVHNSLERMTEHSRKIR